MRDINEIIKKLPPETDISAKPRPYVNHSIELKNIFSAEERAAMLESVGLNVFYFPSELITGCDMLSDSGTTTMTNEQWAALHLGDESYGSNKGYFKLMEQINETFGEGFFNNPKSKPNAFIFHQGRAAEDALFTLLGQTGNGLIIPSNGHFDTTEANIQANKIQALNLFSPELKDENSKSHFKGNMDMDKFRDVLQKSSGNIPLAYLTITNNTGGGQPVSMENIKEVSGLAHDNSIPLFLDACRFAENAWFIKKYESGYEEEAIEDIVKEMFSYADGFTISFKKDGLVNMGGGLFIKDDGMFENKYPHANDALMNAQILKEGHPTYGGLSGRDIMALATGLKIVTKEQYLSYRINQVHEFGQAMQNYGIPVLAPTGGHAVYIDINKFFEGTAMKPGDFGGIALTAVLLAAYGHRACELGNYAFGSYNPKTGEETFPDVNFVRFAVPRLRYERQDLESVAEAVKCLYDERDNIPAVNVTYGKELALRHFKSRFEFRK